ncbi:unnamed protein product [Nesidiocoris tenuis]|uniref:Uncharacterized protein n=1 Tax=Nesidiocoris tenuis TaxID=355587 RepID=A0A6H5FVM0_9HEMI|nr:unnamed protein product [Nesidiocoris tenuis]
MRCVGWAPSPSGGGQGDNAICRLGPPLLVPVTQQVCKELLSSKLEGLEQSPVLHNNPGLRFPNPYGQGLVFYAESNGTIAISVASFVQKLQAPQTVRSPHV